MRYHHTQVRIVIIKKHINNKSWSGEKGTLLHCWWECKLKQLRWEWDQSPPIKVTPFWFPSLYIVLIVVAHQSPLAICNLACLLHPWELGLPQEGRNLSRLSGKFTVYKRTKLGCRIPTVTWAEMASAHVDSQVDSEGEQKPVPGQDVRWVSALGTSARVKTPHRAGREPNHLPVVGESLRIGFVPSGGLSILVCLGEGLCRVRAHVHHLWTREPEWVLTCSSLMASYSSGQHQSLGDLIPHCKAALSRGFIPTANAKRRLNLLKRSGQVDDSESLPLFCCVTPPQGWSFHIGGNFTSKPTVFRVHG